MFEVTKYEFPNIFVTSRRTGETFKFLVGIEGALAHNQARFDQKDASRTALAYLAQRAQAKAGEPTSPNLPAAAL
jgi:hypothetical protein